jgi:hypothetical protein
MDIREEAKKTRPPNFISALLAGFDSISNHLLLLVLPILMDLFLWLGPRLKIGELLNRTITELSQVTGATNPDAANLFALSQDFWKAAAERINLFSALRSYPVGIPSLMAAKLPAQAPMAFPSIQIPSWSAVLGVWIVVSIAGLMIGTIYFLSTAQIALDGKINYQSLFQTWPWSFRQVLILTIIWLVLIIVLSIPASIVLSLMISASIFGQIILLLIGSFVLWMLFPLIYSVHGIFVYHLKVSASVRKSIQVVQMTLPATALFFLSVIVIDQGLGLLWQIPAENSWLILIGVVGHAFVATGLLAASFIYYRDADRWIQTILKRFNQAQAA